MHEKYLHQQYEYCDRFYIVCRSIAFPGIVPRCNIGIIIKTCANNANPT